MRKIKDIFDKATHLRYSWAIKLAITAAVVYAADRNVSAQQLRLLAGDLSGAAVALIAGLGCAGFYCQVKRWQAVLAAKGADVGAIAALRSMLWGCLLAFLTPGRLGELLRGFSLPLVNKRDAFIAVVADKLFAGGAALAAGTACCAVSLLRGGPVHRGHWCILAGTFLCAAVGTALVVLRRRPFMATVMHAMPSFTPRRLAASVVYSFAGHCFLLLQTAALLSMFGAADFTVAVIASGQAYAFMIFFPFFIANMGIREYSFGIFMSAAGGPGAACPTIALGASMGILIVNILLPAVTGLGWWIVDRKKG